MEKIRKILSYPFILLIRLYKKFISPLSSPSCRFTPTCSTYALEAFCEWGPVAGLCLSVWRIVRCNPFSKGGYDPVPKRKPKRNVRKEEKNKPDCPEGAKECSADSGPDETVTDSGVIPDAGTNINTNINTNHK